ncbi:MAG: STAS-like domain-containing protein [Clostridiales bacterium]|jgi:hypothetical protein|nr:STAS-like domain-containing protein [Clostridiales bacterium]MDR2713591.1 STAS-like domain-containing protein [Clostridiales bacterium]
MTIHVEDYIETAFSVDDAEIIKKVIEQTIAANDKVVLDFTGITFFTTLFFSSAVTYYVFELGAEKYDQKFQVVGLTKVGQTAYNHSLDFAREESQLTPEQKQARLAAINSAFDEE